jgi:hypothetical protein
MAIYRPGDWGGSGEPGNVTIIPVEAYLYVDRRRSHVPFSVNFSTFLENEEDPEESVFSMGSHATLQISGVSPLEFVSDRTDGQLLWTPNYTFLFEGRYHVILTVFGGDRYRQVEVFIDALPPLPEDSSNMIIRALRIAAVRQPHDVLDTQGGQI